MKNKGLKFEETGTFSRLFLDYINQKKELEPFYNAFPTVKNFEKLIEKRQFSEEKRHKLAQVLLDEYGPLRKSDAVDFNIHSLEHEKTFTITTGHQLNIFTGPLYFIYKIVSVINICKTLKKAHPNYHFVPVYWMASEDHDLAEINHFHLFGKKYTWETAQKGPVGKLKPHSLVDVIHEIGEDVSLFEKAYLDYGQLSDSVRHYVNKLFGDQGLVVVDGDNAELKEMFAPVIKSELEEQVSNQLVNSANEKLNEAGYSDQAYSREINLFYLDDELRERIVLQGDIYKVLNTDLTFSPSEILELLESNPEKFSPNVILRPLFQETILPNLAYVGGPAEIAYWLQLKGVFDHFQTDFPALMPRNFAMIVGKSVQRKIDKLGLSHADLFKSTDQLKEEHLKAHSNVFDLDQEKAAWSKIVEELKAKAAKVDGSLPGFVGSETVVGFKALDNISKRLKKAEEDKNEIAMNQIETIKDKLFPEGNLQERHDNFLSFYLNNPDFLQVLLDSFDPFDFHFNIIAEG